MLSDNTLLIVIGSLAILCLMIFLVPLYLIRFHPHISEDEIRWLNKAALIFVGLPVILKILFDYYNMSGSIFQTSVFCIVMIVFAVIVAAYSRFTGIKIDTELGVIAGIVFGQVWLASSGFTLAAVLAIIGFGALTLLYIYRQYSHNRVELDCEKLKNYFLAGFIILLAGLLSYSGSHGSLDGFISCFLFLTVGFGFLYIIYRLSVRAQQGD